MELNKHVLVKYKDFTCLSMSTFFCNNSTGPENDLVFTNKGTLIATFVPCLHKGLNDQVKVRLKIVVAITRHRVLSYPVI